MPLSALQAAKLPPWFSAAFHSRNRSLPITVAFPRRFQSVSPSCHASVFPQIDDVDDHIVGDCLVFEDGVFEDPYLQNNNEFFDGKASEDHVKQKKTKRRMMAKKRDETEIVQENLVPEEWRHVQEEVNLSKKDRRKIAQQLEFGLKVEKKKQGLVPLRNLDLKEYLKYKEEKLNQLKTLVLDNPTNFPSRNEAEDPSISETSDSSSSSVRVAPKNPRWAAYGRGFDDVTEFFNSGNYDPERKKSDGPRKLFSKEEKVFLNSRIPDLVVATSSKWLPLHTLAASGEFYLVDSLLKHNVDINAVDKNGLSALHRAIIGKKQAVTSYLLRESANPFILDEEGATLLHYAVQTSSAPTIKLLLLYNVKIDQPDNDGWTPLHVAVQARRTDMVKLLLIKGADKSVRNKDGLTPLDLCLYSGRDTRTYELIKLLKEFPSRRSIGRVHSEALRIKV